MMRFCWACWCANLACWLGAVTSLGAQQPGRSAIHLPDVGLLRYQSSGVEASLRGIAAINDSIAWATGAEGTVLRTEDGGQRWQRLGLPPRFHEAEIRDVHAWDALRALVMVAGQPSVLLQTNDGGKSWRVVLNDRRESAFFDALAFFEMGDRALLFGDPQEGVLSVWIGHDQGTRWRELAADRGLAARAGEAGFAASGSCVATRGGRQAWIGLGGATPQGRARVIRSQDGGRHWSTAETPLPSSASQGIFSVLFFDEDRGVAVGGDYQRPELAKDNVCVTSDGGGSWTKPTGKQPSGFRSAVIAIDGGGRHRCLALGPNGIDLSDDGGSSWRRVSDQGFHAAAAASFRSAWLVGADGRIARLNLE